MPRPPRPLVVSGRPRDKSPHRPASGRVHRQGSRFAFEVAIVGQLRGLAKARCYEGSSNNDSLFTIAQSSGNVWNAWTINERLRLSIFT